VIGDWRGKTRETRNLSQMLDCEGDWRTEDTDTRGNAGLVGTLSLTDPIEIQLLLLSTET
jgi:hypothetical protein